MRNRLVVPPLVAAAAAAGLASAGSAQAAPGQAAAEPLLKNLALQSDCGESGRDLGKAFHLGGPLPVDHAGCASTDHQTLRLDTDHLTGL
ncbi:hypothetical protein [Yinghuangia sp. YIM S09857]|uniref:hypothetical protein n=1 Tax=Yinghuangia sp. YIM S09857 TaxID=3436929 RepID=UPI003F52C958